VVIGGSLLDGTISVEAGRLQRTRVVKLPEPAAISPARRAEVIDALRRGTVPSAGLDLFAVGMERFERAIDEELDGVTAGRAVFKAVRGEYGAGKTFFARWLAEKAKRRGMAAAEVQISETETPLHKLETVYRRLVEQLSTAAYPPSALREIVDAWFYTLEEDVLAEGAIKADDQEKLADAVDTLMERRLAHVARTTPAFAAALRAYRRAVTTGDQATAQSLIAWIGGQPNVAAVAKRAAGVKGDLDHFAALGFLQGLLTILRDSGHPGLLVVLDEIETLQRVRSDVRDKGLNALRQLADDVDSGRFPGLYLLITGTPAFYDGPQGVSRLTPLAQRLATDFGTDARHVPLKALLNNLLPRLETYGGWAGRRVALWHGDTPASRRKSILAGPPDLLLTTPESLESMLVSAHVDHRMLFRDLHAVIVDEVHAFGSGDRGWHLLAVLERLSRIAGRPMQRIGLSATVGNPDRLLEWLQGSSAASRPAAVLGVPPKRDADADLPWEVGLESKPGPFRIEAPDPALDLQLDYVGLVGNAAKVITALHRGEKRLVFADSKRLVEMLGAELRERGVTTHLVHASLSLDERRRAEQAFAEGRDCVIVSTSALELGIDVGDLDRVIQVNSPPTVAAFLQRLGRSGRRSERSGTCCSSPWMRTSSCLRRGCCWPGAAASSSRSRPRQTHATSSPSRCWHCACRKAGSGRSCGRSGCRYQGC
jgi:hypothetical protein